MTTTPAPQSNPLRRVFEAWRAIFDRDRERKAEARAERDARDAQMATLSAREFLYELLDDIDTCSDQFKSSYGGGDAAYRRNVEALVRRRWEVAQPDESEWNGDLIWSRD